MAITPSKLDLSHTLRADIDPDYTGQYGEHNAVQTLRELQAKRMVRTHDSHDVEYSFGSRAQRRMLLGGNGKHKRKQVHKIGRK